MSASQKIFEHYYIWFVIFLLATFNLFVWTENANEWNIFFIVFCNLFILLFSIAYFLNKLLSRIDNTTLLNFLDVPSNKVRFSNITNFLGEQALGSLLATLTIVYGKKIFDLTQSGAVAAIFVFSLFLITITITTLSLTKISIQIIYSKYPKYIEILLFLISFFITYWFYIGGLKLAS